MPPTRKNAYTVHKIPAMRRMTVDGDRLAMGRPFIHGLLEFDVTEARRAIKGHKASTGEALSFTAFIICCLAKAVEAHKEVQAIMDWRGRLIIFEDVNVTTLVEIDAPGGKMALPLVIQAANRKSLPEIHSEIRRAQAMPARTSEHGFLRVFVHMPGFVRRLFYWSTSRIFPQYTRDLLSSVIVTSVGMFGKGAGWGIPLGYFPLNVTVGGIVEKPGVIDGRIEIREILCITLSFDHDVIDGAPATRFAQHFRELVEAAYGLV
jgi:pyruvate/2-oxoglutarate dehydrogenase complex dihydrolipoamide acyltransferase (E2) component